MTQEDKELLLKDLCARLPYGVHLFTNSKHHIRLLTISNDIDYDEQYWINGLYDVDEVKPYLRSMLNMTEEEKKEFRIISNCTVFKDDFDNADTFGVCAYIDKDTEIKTFDWLLKNYFDFMGLISKGLAIEITEENNPYKE